MAEEPAGVSALDLVLLCGITLAFLIAAYLTKAPVRWFPFLPGG